MPIDRQWLERARAIVGDEGLLTDPSDTAAFSHDEFASEELARVPAVVVRPRSEDHVAAIVGLCSDTAVPVTARGGGTGLAAGCVPAEGGIVLSLDRLNRVLRADAADHTITVQAGVTLAALYEEAEKLGLAFPPHPGDESAQIGGVVATNAGGARAVKHGTIRRFVLGLQVVTAAGELVELGGRFVKTSTGYNLMELLIGSEGTLGIITRVTLNLLPPAGSVQTLVVPFGTVEEAIEAVPALSRLGLIPLAVEFVEHSTIACAERLLNKQWPTHDGTASLMLILDGAEEDTVLAQAERVATMMEEGGALDVLIADQKARQAEIMEIRSMLYEALRPATIELFDICVPRSEIAGHVRFVHELQARTGLPLPTYGHAADGNVHTQALRKELADGVFGAEVPGWRETHHQVREALYGDAIRRGGVISGEHGIGLVKRDFLARNLGDTNLRLMRAVKQALDPKGILNPGKVL